MNYQTFEPSDDLKAFVKCFWQLESPAEEIPQKQRIIPDGCMEMIFHFGDLYKQYMRSGKAVIQPRCCVFGQLTAPLEIEPVGVTGIFSVRFHPDGFLPFSDLPIKDYENKAVPLELAFKESGQQLAEEVSDTRSPEKKIEIIESFLLKKLKKPDTIDKIIHSTLQTIFDSNGQLSVDMLSEQLKIHRKKLERKFSTSVGISPKQLSKIIRIQSTLKRMYEKKHTTLTNLAYDGEYYDQAHFIKDFKEFTGVTPKQFYSENLKMSSLFYNKE